MRWRALLLAVAGAISRPECISGVDVDFGTQVSDASTPSVGGSSSSGTCAAELLPHSDDQYSLVQRRSAESLAAGVGSPHVADIFRRVSHVRAHEQPAGQRGRETQREASAVAEDPVNMPAQPAKAAPKHGLFALLKKAALPRSSAALVTLPKWDIAERRGSSLEAALTKESAAPVVVPLAHGAVQRKGRSLKAMRPEVSERAPVVQLTGIEAALPRSSAELGTPPERDIAEHGGSSLDTALPKESVAPVVVPLAHSEAQRNRRLLKAMRPEVSERAPVAQLTSNEVVPTLQTLLHEVAVKVTTPVVTEHKKVTDQAFERVQKLFLVTRRLFDGFSFLGLKLLKGKEHLDTCLRDTLDVGSGMLDAESLLAPGMPHQMETPGLYSAAPISRQALRQLIAEGEGALFQAERHRGIATTERGAQLASSEKSFLQARERFVKEYRAVAKAATRALNEACSARSAAAAAANGARNATSLAEVQRTPRESAAFAMLQTQGEAHPSVDSAESSKEEAAAADSDISLPSVDDLDAGVSEKLQQLKQKASKVKNFTEIFRDTADASRLATEEDFRKILHGGWTMLQDMQGAQETLRVQTGDMKAKNAALRQQTTALQLGNMAIRSSLWHVRSNISLYVDRLEEFIDPTHFPPAGDKGPTASVKEAPQPASLLQLSNGVFSPALSPPQRKSTSAPPQPELPGALPNEEEDDLQPDRQRNPLGLVQELRSGFAKAVDERRRAEEQMQETLQRSVAKENQQLVDAASDALWWNKTLAMQVNVWQLLNSTQQRSEQQRRVLDDCAESTTRFARDLRALAHQLLNAAGVEMDAEDSMQQQQQQQTQRQEHPQRCD